MSRAFEGSAAGQLPAETVLECGVCWWVYDPAEGDPVGYAEPGTPFSALPPEWRCPSCDADKGKFMVLGDAVTSAPAALAPVPAEDRTQEGRVAALVSAYRVAEDAMVGLPVHNGALAVEALGFRPHGEGFAGIIVTPWCMNIVVLPADPAALPAVAVGASRQHVFPSGSYSFIMGRMDGVGTVETCSLFSPMDEFASQDGARAAAEAAVQELFEAPPEPEKPAPREVSRRFILTRNGADA